MHLTGNANAVAVEIELERLRRPLTPEEIESRVRNARQCNMISRQEEAVVKSRLGVLLGNEISAS